MYATRREHLVKPLDPAYYAPDDDEKAFMKATTGIQDDEELKAHVIAVQAKAFEVFKYPCIQSFSFMSLRMARLPAYPQLLELGKERKAPILLDMGCCFGSDVRKAVLDGWPVEGVIVGDLRKDFWDLGHELFRSTPETFPAPHLQGDILDSTFITQAPVLPTSTAPPDVVAPVLSEVTSLNQLHGQLSAIYTGAFFHDFGFDGQEQVARRLAGLLSPLPGSMIFGMHVGQPVKREYFSPDGTSMHCHSPESWRELWEGIFAEVGANVEVKATLNRRSNRELVAYEMNPEDTDQPYRLEWSVTRV